MRRIWWLGIVVVGCSGKEDGSDTAGDAAAVEEPPPLEPLVLPDDPAETGVPVGVRTLEAEGQMVELWYPAPDDLAGETGEPIDFAQFIPAIVTDKLGDIPLPAIPNPAIRDAPVRNVGEALPVVVFSHGFGGTRLQSVDYATHLASRGYVVAAVDHPGRMLGDVLPCLFSPTPEECDLSGFASDPGVEDVTVLLDILDDLAAEGDLAEIMDMDRMGMSGHSAGGFTASQLGQDETRFGAVLSMASPGEVERDVPTLLMDGTCDAVVTTASVDSAFTTLSAGERVRILGAGHLAFSDLCTLELGNLADDFLAGRDDINTSLVPQLVALGTDGCPGFSPTVARAECADAWLSLEVSGPIVRHASTAFFDAHLKGTGAGVEGMAFPDAEVE